VCSQIYNDLDKRNKKFFIVEFSPGANDDGSGVVILLELLSNLVNDVTFTFSDVHLIVLFTNGEEMGLQGAQAFITDHAWRYNIRRFINVDALSCSQVASLIQIESSQVSFNLYHNDCERYLGNTL
jgi:Zn-dependent M28 family amino/carboxypeptidase